jgi:hypothetical protein
MLPIAVYIGYPIIIKLKNILLNNGTNDIDRYLRFLEYFAIFGIVTFYISVFIPLAYYLVFDNNDFVMFLHKIISNKEFLTNYKDDIRLWLFIAYFVSSIYLAIKKPLRICNYSIIEVKIIGILFSPVILGILSLIFVSTGIMEYINVLLKNPIYVLFLLPLIQIIITMRLSNKIYNQYKKIMSNYGNVKSFWKRLTDNQNNNFKNVINEIHAEGIALHVFLWSSAMMLLIVSFLDSYYTIVIYVFLLSIVLYLHWTVAVLFKPIYKIEELTIIGENKTIKNAYLIEETDKEYTIIYKDFLKDIILRVPKDSCILKNVKTPLDDVDNVRT